MRALLFGIVIHGLVTPSHGFMHRFRAAPRPTSCVASEPPLSGRSEGLGNAAERLLAEAEALRDVATRARADADAICGTVPQPVERPTGAIMAGDSGEFAFKLTLPPVAARFTEAGSECIRLDFLISKVFQSLDYLI